jgi:hypothetical protein
MVFKTKRDFTSSKLEFVIPKTLILSGSRVCYKSFSKCFFVSFKADVLETREDGQDILYKKTEHRLRFDVDIRSGIATLSMSQYLQIDPLESVSQVQKGAFKRYSNPSSYAVAAQTFILQKAQYEIQEINSNQAVLTFKLTTRGGAADVVAATDRFTNRPAGARLKSQRPDYNLGVFVRYTDDIAAPISTLL